MAKGWLIILILTLGLYGCGTQAIKTETETVEVVRPILYCPHVDMKKVDRPTSLPIDHITKDTSDGEVAKLYKATIKVLVDYTNRLELILQEYNSFNKSYEELTEELKQKNSP